MPEEPPLSVTLPAAGSARPLGGADAETRNATGAGSEPRPVAVTFVLLPASYPAVRVNVVPPGSRFTFTGIPDPLYPARGTSLNSVVVPSVATTAVADFTVNVWLSLGSPVPVALPCWTVTTPVPASGSPFLPVGASTPIWLAAAVASASPE